MKATFALFKHCDQRNHSIKCANYENIQERRMKKYIFVRLVESTMLTMCGECFMLGHFMHQIVVFNKFPLIQIL